MAVGSITCEELQDELRSDRPPTLVDALPPMSFAHSHLPGAVNVVPEQAEAVAPRRLPDKDARIVVYCANPDCESSHETAAKLAAMGYTDVRHYPGGKSEWRERGLPLERAGKPFVASG